MFLTMESWHSTKGSVSPQIGDCLFALPYAGHSLCSALPIPPHLTGGQADGLGGEELTKAKPKGAVRRAQCKPVWPLAVPAFSPVSCCSTREAQNSGYSRGRQTTPNSLELRGN